MTDETSLVVTLYEVGVYFLVIYKDKANEFYGTLYSTYEGKVILKAPYS